MSWSSMIRAMSRLLTKSGTDGKAGLSRPSNVAWTAPWRTPAAVRMSLRRAPTHSALPIAPSPHCPPSTRGVKVDRGHRRAGKSGLQIVERELERAVHASGDPQTPGGQVDFERYREHMVADKERLVRGDRAVEVLHRCLELRRPRRQQDQIGLLGVTNQGPPRENWIVLCERGRPWPGETAGGQERAEANDALRGVTT